MFTFAFRVVSHDSVENHLSPVISPLELPIVTSEGSKEWIPICSDDIKPCVGMKFHTIDDGFAFYCRYASATGFTVRKSTSVTIPRSDTVSHKYFVCSKSGFKRISKLDRKKMTLHTRVGCPAKMALRLSKDDPAVYEIYQFVEGHYHSMFSPTQSQFEKDGRHMSLLQKKMIVDNSRVICCNYIIALEIFLIYHGCSSYICVFVVG